MQLTTSQWRGIYFHAESFHSFQSFCFVCVVCVLFFFKVRTFFLKCRLALENRSKLSEWIIILFGGSIFKSWERQATGKLGALQWQMLWIFQYQLLFSSFTVLSRCDDESQHVFIITVGFFNLHRVWRTDGWRRKGLHVNFDQDRALRISPQQMMHTRIRNYICRCQVSSLITSCTLDATEFQTWVWMLPNTSRDGIATG